MNKIFVVGISKTGTTSMNSALRILGFTGVDHPHPNEYANFLEGIYDFGTDMPFMFEYKKLDKIFPNSKFILTTRTNLDEWFESSLAQHRKRPADDWEMAYRLFMYGQRGCKLHDRQAFIDIYNEHTNGVLEYFKNRPDDLLVMNLFADTEKWNPLCAFLGKPVPVVPFPHLNKRT